MGDGILFEVVVQGDKVETQFFGNDIDGSTAGQCGVHVHHAGIETITGIGCHMVLRLQVIELMVPVAERHKVAMGELASFGNASGTGGVEQDE